MLLPFHSASRILFRRSRNCELDEGGAMYRPILSAARVILFSGISLILGTFLPTGVAFAQG